MILRALTKSPEEHRCGYTANGQGKSVHRSFTGRIFQHRLPEFHQFKGGPAVQNFPAIIQKIGIIGMNLQIRQTGGRGELCAVKTVCDRAQQTAEVFKYMQKGSSMLIHALCMGAPKNMQRSSQGPHRDFAGTSQGLRWEFAGSLQGLFRELTGKYKCSGSASYGTEPGVWRVVGDPQPALLVIRGQLHCMIRFLWRG